MDESLKIKLSLLPNKPGCYLMKDEYDQIIYVGKAKDLRNRVNSYFTGSHNYKTTKLVSCIRDFDFVITNSDKEAFLLEINLIKKHLPKYNIALKDDKTYPYIALTNEKYPRLYIVRKLQKDKKAKYFGPYPNTTAARNTLTVLRELFPLRKCFTLKSEVCLYYHIGQCLAPCINPDIDYTTYKREITDFLSGKVGFILKQLEKKMYEASDMLQFERANEYKILLENIKTTVDPQNISSNNLYPIDYFGFYYDEENIAIHILYQRQGNINGNYAVIIPIYHNYLDTLLSFINNFYSNIPTPTQICINSSLEFSELGEVLNTEFITPKKGVKANLLAMSNENAKKDLELKFNLNLRKVMQRAEVLDELAMLLDLNYVSTIEAFDNSNLFGEYPISAMVRFKNLEPDYNNFRRFHVKTVVGANDYETMKEVIYRRYSRVIKDNLELPDLILMDGGKIQVNAALDVLHSLKLNIPVAGLKKNASHKLDSLYYNGKDISLDNHKDLYLFLLKVSEKVHNFAIKFFRSTKGKGLFSSRLDNIKGLSVKRKEILFNHFNTIEKIKTATLDELISLKIPKDTAIRIKEALDNEE